MIKLSEEQRQSLEARAGEPVAVTDERTNRVYYLIDEDSFAHLRGLQSEHEGQCLERLRQLIQEGMDSPGVPSEEAFARLRAWAKELSESTA